MTQYILIMVLVGIAFLLLLRQVYRSIKGTAGGCGCCKRACSEKQEDSDSTSDSGA